MNGQFLWIAFRSFALIKKDGTFFEKKNRIQPFLRQYKLYKKTPGIKIVLQGGWSGIVHGSSPGFNEGPLISIWFNIKAVISEKKKLVYTTLIIG